MRADWRLKINQKIMGIIRRGGMCLLFACLLVTPLGCHEEVRGGGELDTLEFDFRDYDVIQVDGIFDIQISQQPEYSLSITLSRELKEYLEVTRQGNVLVLRLRPDVNYVNTIQRAEITLPRLAGINLDGATRTEIDGFVCDGVFQVDMDGASRLELDDVTASEMLVTLRGASRLSGDLKLVTGRILLTDATRVELEGSAGALVLNASDSANADLDDLLTTEANVNLSDAARAAVNVCGTLNLVASGASVLHYLGGAELGLVNISGTATLGRD